VAIEVVPSSVVATSRPRIGVAGGILHVPEACPSIETQREGMSQIVRMEAVGLCRHSSTSQLPEQPPGGDSIHAGTARRHEQGSCGALPRQDVDRLGSPRCERHRLALSTLPGDPEHPVSALGVEMVDIGADYLRDTEAVHAQQ
jgi:hypothetical protein